MQNTVSSETRMMWPYDEVQLLKDGDPGRFVLKSPWLVSQFSVENEDAPWVESLQQNWGEQAMGQEHFGNLQKLLRSFQAFPFAYVLPAPAHLNQIDAHNCIDLFCEGKTPEKMLSAIRDQSSIKTKIDPFIKVHTDKLNKGTWDLTAAIEFASVKKSEELIDPKTLFSVIRRYHLLDSCESDQTETLSQWVLSLPTNAEARDYLAFIVRQNHAVTERCDSALRPAVQTAKSAGSLVLEFIRSEAGHDKLLGRSLQILGFEPAAVPIVPAVETLMELFRWIAGRNFLAFAMVVDMFEKSSYKPVDPLANLLQHHGFHAAAKPIDLHREINDKGGHENVALSFLNNMSLVDVRYAKEAMQLAELASIVMHQISGDTHNELKKKFENTLSKNSA